jgi:hypothetical protein
LNIFKSEAGDGCAAQIFILILQKLISARSAYEPEDSNALS